LGYGGEAEVACARDGVVRRLLARLNFQVALFRRVFLQIFN
jgi:hypothetical protein